MQKLLLLLLVLAHAAFTTVAFANFQARGLSVSDSGPASPQVK